MTGETTGLRQMIEEIARRVGNGIGIGWCVDYFLVYGKFSIPPQITTVLVPVPTKPTSTAAHAALTDKATKSLFQGKHHQRFKIGMETETVSTTYHSHSHALPGSSSRVFSSGNVSEPRSGFEWDLVRLVVE